MKFSGTQYVLEVNGLNTSTYTTDCADYGIALYNATVTNFEEEKDYSTNVTLKKANGTSSIVLLERYPKGKLTIQKDELIVLLEKAFHAGSLKNTDQLNLLKSFIN